jgi:hypothetical protein
MKPFGGRNMTVEVQPPRTGGFGGDRSFGGSIYFNSKFNHSFS